MAGPLFLAMALSAFAEAPAVRRPNFIFILASG